MVTKVNFFIRPLTYITLKFCASEKLPKFNKAPFTLGLKVRCMIFFFETCYECVRHRFRERLFRALSSSSSSSVPFFSLPYPCSLFIFSFSLPSCLMEADVHSMPTSLKNSIHKTTPLADADKGMASKFHFQSNQFKEKQTLASP